MAARAGAPACALLIVVPVAVLAGLIARDGAESTALSRSVTPARVRSIDIRLTQAPGDAHVLYSVRGYHYGRVGRFLASCTDSGLARTSDVLGERGPDALVAVDGRGAAHGAKLAAPNRSLPGGSEPAGIERWIVRTGGQPEEIRLEASLLVNSAKTGRGYCEFSLRGTLVIAMH